MSDTAAIPETIRLLNPAQLGWAEIGLFDHGEIMGLDEDGLLVVWDAGRSAPIHNGIDPAEAASGNIAVFERERLETDAAHLGMSLSSSAPRF